jgi:hypothetical protein
MATRADLVAVYTECRIAAPCDGPIASDRSGASATNVN